MSRPVWVVPLPYDRPPLSLNGRMHWAQQSRWKRQLRGDALLLARAHHLPRGLTRVRVELHWRPRDRRARDSDNPTATLKPLIDGLRDYGLVADDDSAHVSSECVIETTGRTPGMWLTIEEATL
jgi:crossover junction endodeoxyribonuclease RusA